MTIRLKGPNVLITAASAKVLLVQSFKEALSEGGKVFTTGITGDCAAAVHSDGHFVVGPMVDPNTAGEILSLCRKHDIGLVVPTRDGDLPFFAEAQNSFREAGVFVLVAESETIRVCLDKLEFTHFLIENGFPSVPVIEQLAQNTDFPVFARPISGSGGFGIKRLESWDEFALLEEKGKYLFHPFIEAPEFTIDLLMDLEGHRALDAVCRERIQVIAGESKISRVVELPELSFLVSRLGEALGLIGHNTVQAFLDPAKGPLFIEVNPRFGGGSNLSIRAGLDSPHRILQMLAGNNTAYAPSKIRYGATMFRYSQDVIIGLD
jgi:carbamoyl-phosphate synthase large subunit